MHLTFKKFLTEGVIKPFAKSTLPEIPAKGRGGIQYFEDLSPTQVIDFLEHPEGYAVTEKEDGVSLNFGIDENGEFYTSRAAKGQDKKIYQSEDWGDSGASDVFRAAHLALLENVKDIKKIVGKNQSVQIEILYGDQPNAIIYGLNGKSYIVLLKGTINEAVDQLFEALKDKKTKTQTKEITTTDGTNLIYENKITDWEFAKSREVKTNDIKNVGYSEKLNELKTYLAETSEIPEYTNEDILTVDLSAVSKENKSKVKELREAVKNKSAEIIDAIRILLLNGLVRSVKPALQEKNIETPIGIEGLVCTKIDNTLTFKLVDKEEFAKINRFNYKVRDMIKSNVKTDNEDAELEDRGGIFGDAKIRIARLFNIDGLASGLTAKKILRKFKGDSKEATINNIVASLSNSNFQALKKKSIAIAENAQKELNETLETFKSEYKTYEIELHNGKKSYYNEEIKKRTLLAFAEAYQQLEKMKSDLMKADTMNNLIELLYGRKIEEIMTEITDEA